MLCCVSIVSEFVFGATKPIIHEDQHVSNKDEVVLAGGSGATKAYVDTLRGALRLKLVQIRFVWNMF